MNTLPPSTGHRGRHWGVLLLVCAGVALIMGLSRAAPAAPASSRPSAPPDPCAEAVARVQRYKAPGADFTILEAVTAAVAVERRPIQVAGWLRPDARPPQCYVALRLTLSNEVREPLWVLDTTTGRVDALDDLAKQYSGWR